MKPPKRASLVWVVYLCRVNIIKMKNNKGNKATVSEFIERVEKYWQEDLLTDEQAKDLISTLYNGANFSKEQNELFTQARVQSLSGELIPLKILIDVIVSRMEALKDEKQFYKQELKSTGNSFLMQLSDYSNKLFRHSHDEESSFNMAAVTEKVDRINEVFRGQKAFKTLEMLFIVIDQASNGHNTIQTIDDKDYEKSLVGLEIYNKVESLLSEAMRKVSNSKTEEELNKNSIEVSVYTRILHKVK